MESKRVFLRGSLGPARNFSLFLQPLEDMPVAVATVLSTESPTVYNPEAARKMLNLKWHEASSEVSILPILAITSFTSPWSTFKTSRVGRGNFQTPTIRVWWSSWRPPAYQGWLWAYGLGAMMQPIRFEEVLSFRLFSDPWHCGGAVLWVEFGCNFVKSFLDVGKHLVFFHGFYKDDF